MDSEMIQKTISKLCRMLKIRYLVTPAEYEGLYIPRAGRYFAEDLEDGLSLMFIPYRKGYKPRKENVLLVDTIHDTGATMKRAYEDLIRREVFVLCVCLLYRDYPTKPFFDYPLVIGKKFTGRKFLIGYGLDIRNKYRNLKDIYEVRGLKSIGNGRYAKSREILKK